MLFRGVFLFFLSLGFSVPPTYAIPPEGLENFGQLSRGKGSKSLVLFGGYHDPAWRSQWFETGLYAGAPVGGNYVTIGARGSLTPTFGDRDAYFLRYDFRFGTASSLAIKLMHEDWKYIATGKETIGFEYGIFVPVGGGRGGVYTVAGGYYRWLKQRWNDQWWNPVNLQTPDQEGYAIAELGYAQPFGKGGSYYTFDLNYRDPFSYYHFDNVAFDVTVNFAMTPHSLMRFYSGLRTTALYMGTGAVSETYGGLAFVFF